MLSITSESLLEDVSSKLEALREAKRMFAEQLAPDFSFFDYFRSDEMALSACIAGLLNPNGTHGQGSVFLQAFFAHMIDKKDLVFGFENCEVRTEHQANDKRRIDIVLRFDDLIIGIENKPWAGDQNEQLSAYATYLEVQANAVDKKWLFIYICDRDPSPESLSPVLRKQYKDSGNFIQCSFAQLAVWLQECSTKAKALQVRVFIEELHKFVRVRVKRELDMTEEKETTKIILKSQRHLEAAFDVFNTLEATKVKLLEDFREKLQGALNVKRFHLVWDPLFSTGWQKYLGFGVKSHINQDIYLRFEFQGTQRCGLIWGFKRRDDKVTYDGERWKAINDCMARDFQGGCPETKDWPWYSANSAPVFGEDLANWFQNPRPWALLLNQLNDSPSVASRITNLAADLYVKMEDHASKLIANPSLRPHNT